MPNASPPTRLPATTPRTGPHRRHIPEPRNAVTTTTSSVRLKVTGAAAGEAASGTSPSLRSKIGDRVTGISIRTVPATVGVKMRRSADSLAARANWNRDDTMIRVASSPGPPCSSADTLMARKALLVPIIIT